MNNSATFCERLFMRRKELGWTQEQLAEESGVSKRSVVAYEAGKTEPSMEHLRLLAAAMDVTATWLIEGGRAVEISKAAARAG